MTYVSPGATALENDLKELGLENVRIGTSKPTVAAAEVAVAVLTEMKERGYTMPAGLQVGTTSEVVSIGGSTTYGNPASRGVIQIRLPLNLPEDADLDKMVRISLGQRSKSPSAAASLRDVVVHEMGHVQAGWHDHRKLDFAAEMIAKRVSLYAAINEDEFLAETFMRLHRGDELPDNVKRLYRMLRGPEVHS